MGSENWIESPQECNYSLRYQCRLFSLRRNLTKCLLITRSKHTQGTPGHHQPIADMELIKNIAELLGKYPDIKLALLFGSVSRAQAHADSDLDLAIAGELPLESQDKICLIEELAELTGRPIDLVDLQHAAGLILKEALTKGRLIYVTDRTLYAELIKRMLFDQADFMPYRERILKQRVKAWIDS